MSRLLMHSCALGLPAALERSKPILEDRLELKGWCNSSRSCTVKASSVRAYSQRGERGGDRGERTVTWQTGADTPSFCSVCCKNAAAGWLRETCTWTVTHWSAIRTEPGSVLLMSPGPGVRSACTSSIFLSLCQSYYSFCGAATAARQRYSRTRWRISSRPDWPSTT